MTINLPIAGAANADLQASAHADWVRTAAQHGVDLTDFDPAAPFAERCAWARSRRLEIACMLSRYSTSMQHSTDAQVHDIVRFAANRGFYLPPELICVDEGVSGRKLRRAGLVRLKLIIAGKLAQTLLIYKLSRLFRSHHESFRFIEQEVVDEGMRAICTSQGIDTKDENAWRKLTMVQGISDELLLPAIADHVRSGLADLFRAGNITGALTVGYMGVEVPGGRPTKLGRPRRVPAVDPAVAPLIRKHFELVRDGVPISEGWKRWVRAGGPCDPRSTTKQMSYGAYRRLLANPRYIGRWEFGRRRNAWSGKRDYTRQIAQPEEQVQVVDAPELRIVTDELFHAVQAKLASLACGPRGPKRRREPRLWDLVTDCFHCAACSTSQRPVRYYQGGSGGDAMRCKRGALCSSSVLVDRETAVRAVCRWLQQAISGDAELIERTIACAQMDAGDNDDLDRRLALAARKATKAQNKVEDLEEFLGEGSDEDRARTKVNLREAKAAKASAQAELATLRSTATAAAVRITPEQVRTVLTQLSTHLGDGASGSVCQDTVRLAAEAFRLLVGGRMLVHVEPRPGRKRPSVSCTFVPATLATTRRLVGDARCSDAGPADEVRVLLREPPQRDRMAARVHELVDRDGMSYQDAAVVLQREGFEANPANLWQARRRYYELHGEPVPARPYNNGQPRARRTNHVP
jgi:site-specific DNA recombinase